MGARTSARESALQMLYAQEASGDPIRQIIRGYWAELPGDPEGRGYADEIVRGVDTVRAELDALIERCSENWRVDRMARVDRNLLRIGSWELRHRHDVPRAVIIDEAVELAKRYGTIESGKFVNGVLDRVADECERGAEQR